MRGQGVEISPDLHRMITDRFIGVQNAITILQDPSMSLFWDWHIHRFIGRRNWIMDQAGRQITMLQTEAEADREVASSMPVRAKP
eukprot:7062565-Karenia_brevis.AAC.1